MTKEQKVWFEKLQKHIDAMPDNTELSVSDAGCDNAFFRVHNRGDVERFLVSVGYDKAVSWGRIALETFVSENVIPNSENY